MTVSGEDRVRGRRQDDCVGRGSRMETHDMTLSPH